jgi:hypothetical protein
MSNFLCDFVPYLHMFTMAHTLFALQVPQYVLEDYIEMGKVAECNIICSQSRRVSAIGLADHVSKERSQAASETVSLFIIGLSQFQSMDVSSCMSSYRSNSPTGAWSFVDCCHVLQAFASGLHFIKIRNAGDWFRFFANGCGGLLCRVLWF